VSGNIVDAVADGVTAFVEKRKLELKNN